MNNFILDIRKSFFKKPILILSWIALIFSALSCLSLFFYGYFGIINTIIKMIFLLPPYILLVLYITKYYNKLKYPIMIPIIIGLLALYPLVSLFFFFGYRSGGLLNLLFIISCVLAIISSLKGMTKKIYIIIAMSLGILSEVVSLEMLRYLYDRGIYLFIFITELIGAVSIYVALLLFGIKNRIPAIITNSAKKKNGEETSPEYILKLLNDKLELGMITEEEYQTQRAEIISKL